jgi:hypothetical protein
MMLLRSVITFSLCLAYSIVLLHSVIPHHHHDSHEEAAAHHNMEHAAHHHDQQESNGHEHSMHFVHAEEFGNDLFSGRKISSPQSSVHFLIPIQFPDDQPQNEPVLFTPDKPPPDIEPHLPAALFRGPPALRV